MAKVNRKTPGTVTNSKPVALKVAARGSKKNGGELAQPSYDRVQLSMRPTGNAQVPRWNTRGSFIQGPTRSGGTVGPRTGGTRVRHLSLGNRNAEPNTPPSNEIEKSSDSNADIGSDSVPMESTISPSADNEAESAAKATRPIDDEVEEYGGPVAGQRFMPIVGIALGPKGWELMDIQPPQRPIRAPFVSIHEPIVAGMIFAPLTDLEFGPQGWEVVLHPAKIPRIEGEDIEATSSPDETPTE